LADELVTANPLPPDGFKLADDLWIGKIESDVARVILDLVEPPAYGMPKLTVQWAQLYAFVRERTGSADVYRWDEDSRLQTCIALSRLVHATTVSLRYAARARYNTDSSLSDAYPADIRGVGVDTFYGAPIERDWLTDSDAERLRMVLANLGDCPLPHRVSRALWYHEYAVRTYYVEVRWTLVCTALEALVHTDKVGSTKQFAVRVSQMAAQLCLGGFGLTEATRAYDLRSRLAHGQKFEELSSVDRTLYETMETILRTIVLRAAEDRNFASIFQSDEAIRSQWPL
jgi:hypothetical protein